MIKIRIFIIMLIILIFTGCASIYTLKPNYDKNTNILTINDYVLKNATETINKRSIDANTLGWEYKMFIIDDNVCGKIAYAYTDISNTRRYYLTSAIEDVQSNYKNKCIIEKINNLNFFKCPNYKAYNGTEYNYGITSSDSKDSGYGIKTKIYLGNEAVCFNDIKDYFKNIHIKKSNVKSQTTKSNINIYRGTFIATNTSKCASMGKISIYLNKNEVGGNITYKLKNKDHMSAVKGSVIGNKFAGSTGNIKFIGTIKSDTLEGTYYNDSCKGVFSAKLEK